MYGEVKIYSSQIARTDSTAMVLLSGLTSALVEGSGFCPAGGSARSWLENSLDACFYQRELSLSSTPPRIIAQGSSYYDDDQDDGHNSRPKRKQQKPGTTEDQTLCSITWNINPERTNTAYALAII